MIACFVLLIAGLPLMASAASVTPSVPTLNRTSSGIYTVTGSGTVSGYTGVKVNVQAYKTNGSLAGQSEAIRNKGTSVFRRARIQPTSMRAC